MKWVGLATTCTAIATTFTSCSPENEPDNPTEAPKITPGQTIIDVSWWKDVFLDENNRKLKIGDILVATREGKDINEVKLLLDWNPIKSWTTLNKKWTLTLKIRNKAGRESKLDITLTVENQLISWLENLKNIPFQVDKPENLMNYITLANDVSIEYFTVKYPYLGEDIKEYDAKNFLPKFPWNLLMFKIVVKTWWKTQELETYINVLPKNREPMELVLKSITAEEIQPILWNIEVWDPNICDYILNTSIPEGYEMVRSMQQYWTTTLTSSEYKRHLNRIVIVFRWEKPSWEYEVIWWGWYTVVPDEHSDVETQIVTTRVPDLLKTCVINDGEKTWYWKLAEYSDENTDKIIITWSSKYEVVDNYNQYQQEIYNEDILKLCEKDNLVLIAAWTNVSSNKRRIINWSYWNYNDYYGDWCYSLASLANSKMNDRPNSHIFVTIGTDVTWNINQTFANEGSKYPEWFNSNSLLAWRVSPYRVNWLIYGPTWKYTTSYSNYFNVALLALMAELNPSIKDIDELLEMARSTQRHDIITYWNQSEILNLLDVWSIIKTELMPKISFYNVTFTNNSEWIYKLEKWEYPNIIFDIPWAVIKINWEWIPYSKENWHYINNTEIHNYERWISNSELMKLWYNIWDHVEWKAIPLNSDWKKLDEKVHLPIHIEIS